MTFFTMKRYIFLFVLLFSISFVYGEGREVGLHFNSHTHLAEKRTTLELDNGEGIRLRRTLTFSFDMEVRKENTIYGFVFRMISDNDKNIDFMFSLDSLYQPFPELIVDNDIYPLAKKVQVKKSIPVKITLSREDNRILLVYNNSVFEVPYSFGDIEKFYVSFGKCRRGKYTSNDVAPVNLKNIRVYDDNKLIRNWLLSRHQGNICYDEVKGKMAVAQYPSWLIDDYWKWKEVVTKRIENNVQFAFDSKNTILYIVPDEMQITALDLKTVTEKIIKVKKGYPAASNYSQMVMDTIDNKLISFNLDNESLSTFSFADQTWSSTQKPLYESIYWHHASLYSSKDSCIYTFGGYGGYKYNNTLIRCFWPENRWEKRRIDEIFPRYSAAISLVGENLYIFGGRGSKTGRQELSTEYTYDLHKINIHTGKVSFVGDFAMDNITYLPAENMIFNEQDSSFYLLANLDGARLIRLSLRDKKAYHMGDAIPGNMSSLHLYRNLLYSSRESKLYAVYDKVPQNGIKTISIYSMKYPPLREEDTLQLANSGEDYQNMIIISSLIFLVGSLFLILSFRKKRKQRKRNVALSETLVANEILHYDISFHSICLLGGFSVRNKKGEGITAHFTPTLRQLLLVLILYTYGGKKGILSSKLDELLWGDKDESSARNNRNVSIRKLRVILEEVGDITIHNHNNYWEIIFGENVFCDYKELSQFLQDTRKLKDPEDFSRFMELAFRGTLLPNMQIDWIDPFKAGLSSEVIDILLAVSVQSDYDSPRMQIKIADAIFANDPLNEEALSIKCVALFNSGKTGIAKNTYDKFCKEYKSLLNESYPVSFNSIIKK